MRAPAGTQILRTLGRALTIRHVDAGSCNGCELEIHALTTRTTTSKGSASVSSRARATPTCCWSPGPVSKHMAIALQRTYDATPEPKLVVAVGDCGCSGGIFGESYATLGAVVERAAGRRRDPGLPAVADGAAAGHSCGDHDSGTRRQIRFTGRGCIG